MFLLLRQTSKLEISALHGVISVQKPYPDVIKLVPMAWEFTEAVVS